MRAPMLLAVATLLAACGEEIDDRPPTLEYVAETILAPSCGTAACHSSFKNAEGWTLDSADAVLDSVRHGQPDDNGVIRGLIDRSSDEPDNVDSTLLMVVLTRNVKRMPYDQPLADEDKALIREWIKRDVYVQGEHDL